MADCTYMAGTVPDLKKADLKKKYPSFGRWGPKAGELLGKGTQNGECS